MLSDRRRGIPLARPLGLDGPGNRRASGRSSDSPVRRDTEDRRERGEPGGLVRATARRGGRFGGNRLLRDRRCRVRARLRQTPAVQRRARRLGARATPRVAPYLYAGPPQCPAELPRPRLHALSQRNVRSRFRPVNFDFNFQLTRKRKFIIAGILLTPILIFALYTWSALQWSYSEGERAGFVQKFSKKGWLCKTWEGELAMVSMPGTNPEKFYFTVRDDNVAQHINESLGRRVALTYQQHKGIPTTCFGETEYFVVAVKVLPQ